MLGQEGFEVFIGYLMNDRLRLWLGFLLVRISDKCQELEGLGFLCADRGVLGQKFNVNGVEFLD